MIRTFKKTHTIMLLMDRETDSLNRVRDLIHMQQEAIDNYMEWEDNV